MTLVILAAGMGSRYGGLKQIDPMTENGEFIIDFSVYDAIASGFDKVIFVIKEENYNIFRETVGKRIESAVNVQYAFQRVDDIPSDIKVPEGRQKPWGTAHATLAARKLVTENFAVINADDFYGRQAFELLADHLKRAKTDKDGVQSCCMIGYRLGNTLTENGTVSRGICECGVDSMLCRVTERTKIARDGKGAKYIDDDGISFPLSADSIASMNCWGFTSKMLDIMWEGFKNFLGSLDFSDEAWKKKEYYLPFSVEESLESGQCSVKVYPTNAVWYGVTYHEDKARVKSSIEKLIRSGEYPFPLWKK